MRTEKLTFCLLAAMLGGCLIPSIHPLYTDEELIFEEKLVGKWSDGNDIWEFKKGEGKAYKMRVFDGKQGRFEAHLVELKGVMFLDIFPDGETLDDVQDFYKIHLVPMHTFMKVGQIEPKLQLQALDYEKVSEMLKDDPNLLKHEVVDDQIILTAHTKQLQQFMTKYANVEGVFGDTSELTRREPLYTEEDLVFDENLIGVWEGKDGKILDFVQMGEKAYDIIFIEEKEGTELQFFANLVKLKGMMFFGVFSDKSSLEHKDSYGSHLIPDYVVRVDQIQPKLLLRYVTYEEATKILKEDAKRLKQETADVEYTFEGIPVQP